MKTKSINLPFGLVEGQIDLEVGAEELGTKAGMMTFEGGGGVDDDASEVDMGPD